ncbi:hypothetical protein CW304_21825 [Bacillus sp. UFRGS-B20]|nr:hypothetical protein CW304_21825 [Bacillus sp. UFRGS-B20]
MTHIRVSFTCKFKKMILISKHPPRLLLKTWLTAISSWADIIVRFASLNLSKPSLHKGYRPLFLIFFLILSSRSFRTFIFLLLNYFSL